MSSKFLIIGDLHGNKPKIYFKDFDYIIAPGDFCSDKGLRPLMKKWLNNKNTIKDFDKFISRTVGNKKYRTLKKESLKVGRSILSYLNSFSKPVFIVPGNWDESYAKSRIKNMEASRYNYARSFLDYFLGDKTNPYLTKGLKNIYDCQYKLYKFENFNIIGYGLSSNNEKDLVKSREEIRLTKVQSAKLNKDYNKLIKKLENAYSVKDKNKPTIFLSHNVPFNTKLDILINKESEHHKKHFGSTVALDFCEKYQPLVCIGGHMHEHFGKDKIGKTTVINAGFGIYVNTLLEIEGNKIKKLKFYRRKS
ncbi:metallophosphoesterase [Candidatus Woesearchaeota archaeon]|nr:metallophosphoesterase [Candidatus Woesearchaeota archaeon]